MFNRTAPRALALAFAIVVAFVLAIVAVTAIPVASAPSSPAARVVPCSAHGDGMPVATGTDVIGGACFLPFTTHINGDDWPNLDTVDYGTDIPRCASDDWNSTGLPRCYTLRVTDGAVIIIGADDSTLATLK